jgi:epoxyqueuosine reductase QueG
MHLKSELINAGYSSLIPTLDERFWSNSDLPQHEATFTSNWSERHVAFICGLGTFGLSKGLITQKGIAGRVGSILTELFLSPDKKEYENIYEYCSMCGKCVKNCPVNAISEKGVNQKLCRNHAYGSNDRGFDVVNCNKCRTICPMAFGKK